jgi:hypothetical protein
MIRLTKSLFLSLSLLILLCQCAFSPKEVQTLTEEVPVSIRYVDLHAQKVCIAGNFNQWSPESHCMKNERGTWSIQLRLSPGRYQYIFVIDGRLWKTDPDSPIKEESGFGTENSVFVVE